ncbi:MAG: hypothetical protein ACYSXF_01745 [Planctomycetota bacterium]
MRTVPSYVIAACVALAAFAVATLAGLATGNSAASILFRALIAMLACYPVGLLVGMACQRVIAEQLEAHRAANPIPQEEPGGPAGSQDDDVIAV